MIYPWLWITCPDAPCMNGFPYIYPPCTHILDLGWLRSKKSPWSYEKNTWHGDFQFATFATERRSPRSFRGLPAPPGGLGGLFGGGEESSSSSTGGGLGGGLGGLFDETQTDGKTKGPMKLGKKRGDHCTPDFLLTLGVFWSKSTT